MGSNDSLTWSHHKLGTFEWPLGEYDSQIVRPLDIATEATGFAWCVSAEDESVRFGFEDDDITDAVRDSGDTAARHELIAEWQPPAEAIDLAIYVLENSGRISEQIVASLWDQFNGVGEVGSGMWWYGASFEEIFEFHEEVSLAIPKQAADLKSWLSCPRILMQSTLQGHSLTARPGMPTAHFDFHSDVDPEHGIGFLLTPDGVLAAGYGSDTRLPRSS